MRVLVTGAGGQVGVELARARWPTGTKVVAMDRAACDITDRGAVDRALQLSAAELVVNAAAYTAVDRAESDVAAAFAANEAGARHLADAAAARGVPLIHISTDYVLDGSGAAPRRETDPVAPLNVYGRSKAAGEAAVRAVQPRHVILRTSWVHAAHGSNFVRTMLRLAAERPLVSVVSDQVGAPTAAASIAAVCVAIGTRLADDQMRGEEAPWGTYHFADAGETTWLGLAQHVLARLRACGMRCPRLVPITTAEYPTPARRPANSRLDCSLIETTWGIVRQPWQAGVDRVLDRLLAAPSPPARQESGT